VDILLFFIFFILFLKEKAGLTAEYGGACPYLSYLEDRGRSIAV
jgi:hypothetical protein